MMIRKDLILAILTTFCLTATSFLIIPTRSQTTGQYDPWLDWNGDGKINLIDVFRTELAFGTSGDSTKNVSVTNWPSEMNINITHWDQRTSIASGTLSKYVGSVVLLSPTDRAFTDYVSVDGFTKYMLYFNMTGEGSYAYALCYFRNAGIEAWGEQFYVYSGQSMFGWYDVKGPEMRVALANNAYGNATLEITIYAVR